MESYELLGFLGILRECIKVLSKNGKLMATIATFSILVNSLLLFTNTFSTEPVIRNLLAKGALLSTPNSASNIVDLSNDIKYDVQFIVGVGFIFVLASFAFSLLFAVATILASAVACCGKRLSFQDLLSRLPKVCLRSLVTLFHLKLLSIGYISLLSIVLICLVIINIDYPLNLIPITITIGGFATILLINLSVVWELSLVTSVIEESCYGMEALGKAGRLVKGKRLHGFALNFLSTLAMVIVSQGIRVTQNQKSVSTQIVFGFFLAIFGCLVKMFQYMSFTVLYFQCKKTHGEGIELQGSLEEYTKIPSVHDLP